jgi:Ca2+-binding RTX toxin-like protein
MKIAAATAFTVVTGTALIDNLRGGWQTTIIDAQSGADELKSGAGNDTLGLVRAS